MHNFIKEYKWWIKSYFQEIQDTAFQENIFYLHGESDIKLYTMENSKY